MVFQPRLGVLLGRPGSPLDVSGFIGIYIYILYYIYIFMYTHITYMHFRYTYYMYIGHYRPVTIYICNYLHKFRGVYISRLNIAVAISDKRL